MKQAIAHDTECYVYLLKWDSLIKIGRTIGNPYERISNLKVGNPSLKEWIAFKTTVKTEEELHIKFQTKHVYGEWFYLNDKDINTIYDTYNSEETIDNNFGIEGIKIMLKYYDANTALYNEHCPTYLNEEYETEQCQYYRNLYNPAKRKLFVAREKRVRKKTIITFGSESLDINQWATKLNVKAGLLQKRINEGWDLKDVLTSKNVHRPKQTSRFRGVRKQFGCKKFEATISCKKTNYHIGTFDTEEEAARAYDKKALELYGENAILNFLDKNTKYNTAKLKYRGVKKSGRGWAVSIKHKGKSMYLGTYKILEEAAKAYDCKAKELLENRAILNFPDEA